MEAEALHDFEWYVGKVSRGEAEEKVRPGAGAFVVSDCEEPNGDFIITVNLNHTVKRFKILRDGAGKYFLSESTDPMNIRFKSLNDLVEYHKKTPINRSHEIYLKELSNFGPATNAGALSGKDFL